MTTPALTRGTNDGPGFQLAAARPHGPAPGRRAFFGWLTYGLGAVAAAVGGPPLRRLPLRGAQGPGRLGVPGAASTDFPPDQTRLVTFDNPHPPAVGRHGGSDRRLRPLRGPRREGGRRDEGAQVPGPRRQLRPPGLPGRVVPAVGPVHVPLPRRRLLRQRRTRLRPAAARPLPLRLPGDASPAASSSWRSRRRTTRPCRTPWNKPA